MIILHIAPINTTVANGLRFSVPGLVSAQVDMGLSVALLNIEKKELYNEESIEKKNITVYHEKVKKIDELEEPFNRPDIVIFHGIYRLEYLSLYKQLIERNIPYIIVPRVSLTRGAQKQKALKKKLSNILFFNKFIYEASAIHYLTDNEKNLSVQLKQKFFIVGNGIDIPILKEKNIKEGINLTFIGRYDIHHKGLDILISSLASIKDFLIDNKVQVDLYGSDFRGGKKYLLKSIEKHGLHKIVNVNEAIFGKKKEEVLRATDVFITTSRFEGHPMAVIGAMSYGIPCILTEGTNMQEELIEYGAGWKADLVPKKIAEKIIKAVNNPAEVYYKGLSARKLIENNYTWAIVAEKTVEIYKDLIRKN